VLTVMMYLRAILPKVIDVVVQAYLACHDEVNILTLKRGDNPTGDLFLLSMMSGNPDPFLADTKHESFFGMTFYILYHTTIIP
jgi:hypothetical protein